MRTPLQLAEAASVLPLDAPLRLPDDIEWQWDRAVEARCALTGELPVRVRRPVLLEALRIGFQMMRSGEAEMMNG